MSLQAGMGASRRRGIWGVVVTNRYLLGAVLEPVKEEKIPIITIGDSVSNSFTRVIEEQILHSREGYSDQ